MPFSSPGDLPDPGIKLASPASPALAGKFFTTEPSGKPVKDVSRWARRLAVWRWSVVTLRLVPGGEVAAGGLDESFWVYK